MVPHSHTLHFRRVFGHMNIPMNMLKRKRYTSFFITLFDYPINLSFHDITFRVTITLKQNYQIDLTKSNFYELIGFDNKVIKDKTNIGPRVPNLSQDTDMLNIHCDLVNDSLVDGECDIIYSFSKSVLTPSDSFTLEPRRITYNPVNKNTISSIRIYITDGKRSVLDLYGADTSFSLILKRLN